ncbi:hypothetical protein BT93_C0832 [Corymbia citriodora subsp. variegata]|nr:hypothetical protein BT93_C0832 [Corymbia citriodora subsp. variegata]
MVYPRRKGADKINDPKKCDATFSKRCHGLLKKASALHSLTGARVAVIVFSPKDKLCSFGEPSVEDVFFEYLHCKGDVTLPMSPKESVDLAEKECDSCVTKEDCVSLIMKHQVILNLLCKKLKALESNPAVNAGAGDDSGVAFGAGNDFKILNGDEINSLERNYETCHPSFVAGVDHDILLTSPFDLAAGGENLGMDANTVCSNLEGFGSNLVGHPNLSMDAGFWTLW